MNLFELFEKNEFLSVWAALETIYPDSKEEAYRSAWEEIIRTLPKYPKDHPKMQIMVRTIPAEDDMFAEEDYVDVSGIDIESEYGDRPIWALDFTSWAEWLYMDIHPDVLENFGEAEALAHLLWEMTFHGYQSSNIDFKREKLFETTDEIRQASEEGRLDEIVEDFDLDDVGEREDDE